MVRTSTCSLSNRVEAFFEFSRYKQVGEGESKDTARQILRTLSPTQREVLVLYLLDNLTPKEISRELSLPPTTVYSRIYNAKKKLKGLAPYFFL